MPKDIFKIAKTHKDVIIQKFMDTDLNGLGSGGSHGELIYRGRTTNATPTELFIGGKTQTGTGNVRRLYMPENSAILYIAYALAWNQTDDVLQLANLYRGGVKNTNNTVAAIKDYETTTGGTQAFSLDPAFASVAVPLYQGLSYNLASDTVAFTADDTNKSMTVTATGTAAKTIIWNVFLQCFTITSTANDRFYGDSAAGVGL